ncbi:hypothetical protein MASR1M107_18950 [Ignavibacteriales bacterium]
MGIKVTESAVKIDEKFPPPSFRAVLQEMNTTMAERIAGTNLTTSTASESKEVINHNTHIESGG